MPGLSARVRALERRGRPVRLPEGALEDVATFTEVAGTKPLRAYQAEAARAVVASIRAGRGDVITVMCARQMGKNQTSAALELYLLHLYRAVGGQIVKAAPTFIPQVVNSKLRLQRELQGPYSAGQWKPVYGYGLQLGYARILLFSADPNANVVGATADILLEIDEAQDVDELKYLRDFRPMAATTNATTVLYGTALSEDCLLEKQRQENIEREKGLGRRLHFEYDWRHLAAVNPAYGRFVEGEIARLGAEHPVIKTQYLLQAMPALGKFLSQSQREQLRGAGSQTHDRLIHPMDGDMYVCGIDVAGEDEEAADAVLRALKPRRDSTVVTIGRVRWTQEREVSVEVVRHYWWTGRDHAQQLSDLKTLIREVWNCRRVVVDATGVGAGLASWLAQEFGEELVEQFKFTAPAKSALGYQLLGMVNTGRCRMYASDDSPEWREFWVEVGLARYEMRAQNQLRWFVPETEGHDDFLVSLALCCQAAEGALPAAESAIIRPRRLSYGD